MNKTLDYYNEHAKDFIASTAGADMRSVRDEFSRLVAAGGRILDFGCGSGRDSLAFLSAGFEVVALDGSEKICEALRAVLPCRVEHCLFSDFKDVDAFDGVWACASLLHVREDELPSVFRSIYEVLHKGGIFYCSFKYGDFSGMRNGRFFTDMTEGRLEKIIRSVPGFAVVKMWTTGDVRARRGDERWLNAILKKTF